MSALEQQFKQSLLQALNEYTNKFNDNNPMSLNRSREVAFFVDQLEKAENPLDLHDAVHRRYKVMDISWVERVFSYEGSTLRKGIKNVLIRFPYAELLADQVKKLLKSNTELSQEKSGFEKEIADLRKKLSDAEKRIKELEDENAGLRTQLQAVAGGLSTEIKVVMSEHKPDDGAVEKLVAAEKTIALLEKNQNELIAKNSELQNNNRTLCEQNINLLKRNHDLLELTDQAAVKRDNFSLVGFRSH